MIRDQFRKKQHSKDIARKVIISSHCDTHQVWDVTSPFARPGVVTVPPFLSALPAPVRGFAGSPHATL